MKAADVMVTNVVTVGPDASIRDVARTLVSNRISAVPVVATDGKLLGIASEGDLMRRVGGGTAHPRAWWLTMLTRTRDEQAAEYVKENSQRVGDVMTRNPAPSEIGPGNDFDIRNSIIMRLEWETWARPCLLNVIVHDGKVKLWGTVETQIEKNAVLAAVEGTPGVRAVKDYLLIEGK